MQIRDVDPGDFERIRSLNELALPAVNSIPVEDFAWFSENAAYFRVVVDEAAQGPAAQAVVAYLIALTPGSAYESLNYRWFCERYTSFIYVDRIVVAQTHQGQQIGQRLYADLAAFCGDAIAYIGCEVNTRPPNPGSMRFHTREGFVKAGEQTSPAGDKAVAFLIRSLG